MPLIWPFVSDTDEIGQHHTARRLASPISLLLRKSLLRAVFHKARFSNFMLLNETLLQLLNIQGEHKVFPRLQTFITRKLRGIQTYFFLPLLKLVSKILCHVFIVMLQLHNLLVSKWHQWRRKPSGKDFMLTLYFKLPKGPPTLLKTNFKVFYDFWAGFKFLL